MPVPATQTRADALEALLHERPVLILDGGLATELEARGYDLSDELWSARLLIADPGALRDVHAAYLEAGADCLISASYQATLAAFLKRGLTEEQAVDLLRFSVTLACEARDAFWDDPERDPSRVRPLVAASVGPFGAALADGSEFTGAYASHGMDAAALYDFHKRRFEVLASSGADLIACETLPALAEALALLRLAEENDSALAWFSFSCRDGEHISDGTPIRECAAALAHSSRVFAIGVNCTAPRHVESLIAQVRRGANKPMVVYPNSGERYDAATRSWTGDIDADDFAEAALAWKRAGAVLIGGCCRTGPAHIRALRDKLVG